MIQYDLVSKLLVEDHLLAPPVFWNSWELSLFCDIVCEEVVAAQLQEGLQGSVRFLNVLSFEEEHLVEDTQYACERYLVQLDPAAPPKVSRDVDSAYFFFALFNNDLLGVLVLAFLFLHLSAVPYDCKHLIEILVLGLVFEPKVRKPV